MPTRAIARASFVGRAALDPPRAVGPPRTGGAVERSSAAAPPRTITVAGAIVGLPTDIDPSALRALLDSLLFAQVTASAQYDRVREATRWYAYAVFVLEALGWVVEASAFDAHETQDRSTLADVLRDVTPDGGEIVEQALADVEALDERDPANTTLAQFATPDAGHIQLGLVAGLDPLVLEVSLVVYERIGPPPGATSDPARPLSAPLDVASSSIRTARTRMTLNRAVYAVVADEVARRLDELPARPVFDLPPTPTPLPSA